ncbi:MAG TPA: aldehyde dehydrogenase family protein [Paracoccus sp. (in: a-proteobacteria)]|uniref:aldehyde dehydrogenase family protein n=1 Tax=Paracoccus sp. TaxID=267 RepID=UPI002BD2C376|nr:aldehyde dehydrogenase family protein [Paracoccus sp. (in: a-proteobacteria)]HWL57292.1 aldehyde dehydrogenase family protein [Paracoccus sp. (in: a-proteobacteria)]
MTDIIFPENRELYYRGAWHKPLAGEYDRSVSPATGEDLGCIARAMPEDVAQAVAAAQAGFAEWRQVAPQDRAKIMREASAVMARHGEELTLLDAVDCGNPAGPMAKDAASAVARFQYFAGLVSEMKGSSIPSGPDSVNFSVREPLGVVARIIAFNHPFSFFASKIAAPLAAGNAVIVKPSEQAPLSALRLAELIGPLFPAGVLNVLTGGPAAGETLSSHPGIAAISLVGSARTGRAIARAAADTLKVVTLELGGKNALIAFPDADPEQVARMAVSSMNYAWCGQSCGSMSRAFLHEAIHDEVIERMGKHLARYRPGVPTDPKTTMGALINRAHHDRVLGYIAEGQAEGARLVYGGTAPDDPALAGGCFLQPTVFADVTQSMRIANEEIFGPVQSILRWSDEKAMLADVNSVPYGLTASIFTSDITKAHRAAADIQAGYIWINGAGKRTLGAPFGGYKQSGLGRDDCLGELLATTQEKNIHIYL